MSQKSWIIKYIEQFGSVTPALMGGKVWAGKIWPSQGYKRCRELRKAGTLESGREGKFEKFWLVGARDVKKKTVSDKIGETGPKPNYVVKQEQAEQERLNNKQNQLF